MPPTVRLKQQDKQRPVETRKIVELAYGKFNVPFTRIFSTNDGFKVICRDEQDADKMHSKEAKGELGKLGLLVITPPETKAKRSIIIRQLDQIIGSNTPEDIKQELEKENEWIRVEEVVKIKDYTHIIKIRLEEISMAQKAQQHGILAYNMAISPNQIEQEKYVHIRTCFNCYQMEDHLTKECPYSDLKICSECSETGHTYKDCKNSEKACINCKRNGNQANHRTLAMSCPLRKTIITKGINEDRSKMLNKEENTYAAIARRAVAEAKQTETTTQINLSDYKHTKILISIMHAHVINLCNPGSYQTELNRMLEKNELPTMWFPDNPDSGKLLGATAAQSPEDHSEINTNETSNNNTEAMTTNRTENENPIQLQPAQPNRDPRLESRNRIQETGAIPKQKHRSHSRHRQETTTEKESTPKGNHYPENAHEIGLKIYLTGQAIVPTNDPHIEFILEQIQTGKCKWTYGDSRYDEELIKQLLSLKKLKISKHDYKRIDEGSYRKIRNGLNIRSPPQETRKTKKSS